MLLLALKEAARYGWQLAASADVSAKYVHQENGPDYPADVHSWFFCYQGENPSSGAFPWITGHGHHLEAPAKLGGSEEEKLRYPDFCGL